MTAAPYFHTQFTAEASKELTEQVQQRFLNVVSNLSKTLGLNVRQVFDNLGGFHDDKLNSQVRELSYTIEFDDADIDKINLFTCLLGDLGHEVQNSVYNIRYTDKDDTKADGVEYTLKCDTSDRHKLADKLEELGIENYSIDRDGIHMLYFNGDNKAEFLEKWQKVLDNIEGEDSYQKIHNNYFEAADRAKLYDEELKKFGEEEKELENEELKPLKDDVEWAKEVLKGFENEDWAKEVLKEIDDEIETIEEPVKRKIIENAKKALKNKNYAGNQIKEDFIDIVATMAWELKLNLQSFLNKFILHPHINFSRDQDNITAALNIIHERENYSQKNIDDYLEHVGYTDPLLTQKLFNIAKKITDELDVSWKEVYDTLKRFSVRRQDEFAKDLQEIYDNHDNLQNDFDAYIQGLTGKELKPSKEDNVQINQNLNDVITEVAKDLDWDFDTAFKEFSKEKQKSVANDLNYIYSHEDSRALRGIVEGYLYRLKDDSPILHSDLNESISDIADRLSWDDNTRKTIFNKFRGISYEKQKQIGDDLYDISMEPGSNEEVQSKVDKYINKLEEELKASKEKNAPKSEEELKKLRETYPEIKEDLFNTVINIADEFGVKPDSYLKEVDGYPEKIQDQITKELKKLSERIGFSKSEVDRYLSNFEEDGEINLISRTLYYELLHLLKTLGLKGQSLFDVLEDTYLSKFEKFSYEQQDKFAEEINDFYEKYKDNKQELQSQFDIYIDNLNVKLKKLEEDDLRRKESNGQRFDTKNDRLDTQKLPERKVREQDRRLYQLLNEALETNRKYQDSGGTAAIQTGETLKEGTNAITPGQTYEDYVRENQDGVAYFEAFIPVYDSIFKEFADSEGTISVEALEYLHPDIMKMIVYRIPTEGRHSIMPVKGIQFMPIEMGGTIMLPDEMIHLLKQTI